MKMLLLELIPTTSGSLCIKPKSSFCIKVSDIIGTNKFRTGGTKPEYGF